MLYVVNFTTEDFHISDRDALSRLSADGTLVTVHADAITSLEPEKNALVVKYENGTTALFDVDDIETARRLVSFYHKANREAAENITLNLKTGEGKINF